LHDVLLIPPVTATTMFAITLQMHAGSMTPRDTMRFNDK
jgi:hypothetical protein